MSPSFFQALNPLSTQSGIKYSLGKIYYVAPQRGGFISPDAKEWQFVSKQFPCQGQEMIDATLSESIRAAIHDDLNFIEGIITTFNILVGDHYDINLKGWNDNKGGAKGVFDFLILPLLARKLIADTFLAERTNILVNAIAWTIALPIEIARFGAGIALTLLLAPVVAVVHLIKACMPNQEQIQEPVMSGLMP